jgi:hypothetical protein
MKQVDIGHQATRVTGIVASWRMHTEKHLPLILLAIMLPNKTDFWLYSMSASFHFQKLFKELV